MPQSKVLVDTNSYLRLAKNIRPLLFIPFGNDEYCLYVIDELNVELRSKRLTSKFPWVTEEEFVANRQAIPNISKQQRKSIAETFEFVWYEVLTSNPGPSKVDARYIAYAIELGVSVITDDQDMTALAESFNVRVMPTLELLKIMLDAGHVTTEKVESVINYWQYIGDKPSNFERDYERFFGGVDAT
jgi:predicted nucleic acid-binding protein